MIANIRSDDNMQRARGETFLLGNPDPGVRLRPAEQLDRAIDIGQGLLVSDEKAVKAISLVYQYDPGPGWPVAYEIGSMRVTLPGRGLQVFLAQLHLIQIFLEDDTTRGDIFAVVTPGTPSAHNLTVHVGMQPFEPPDILRLLRAEAGVAFDPAKTVLAAGLPATRRAFAALGELHLGELLFRTPKGNETIEIAMGWFDPELLKCGP